MIQVDVFMNVRSGFMKFSYSISNTFIHFFCSIGQFISSFSLSDLLTVDKFCEVYSTWRVTYLHKLG